MARPLRILFAALALPYPPTNGHRLRTWALLRALVEDGHRVTLVSFVEAGERRVDLGPLRTLCAAFHAVRAPAGNGQDWGGVLRRMRALASALPYGAWKFRSEAFKEMLAQRLAEAEFDLILCDGIYNAPNLPPHSSSRVVLNKDDVNHVLFERWLRLERNPLLRVYGLLERSKIKRWEATACQRVTGILACSEVDRAILTVLCPRVPTFVIPNVVDTEHCTPRPEVKTACPIVLYQGGMDWHPNRDAVHFFVTAVLPALRRLVPSAVFRVAGRNASASFLRRFAGIPGVEFSGTVPDMRDEIARATVCVVPLRIGSGTRLKILEAGAMAKAIVSTTLGAEGLDLVDGEEIMIADTPEAFAGKVAALLADGARRDAVGQAARLRIEKHYSFGVCQSALRGALRELGL